MVNWEAVGELAYLNGLERVPLMDSGVGKALDNGGDILDICEAWLNGWDSANLYGDDKDTVWIITIGARVDLD